MNLFRIFLFLIPSCALVFFTPTVIADTSTLKDDIVTESFFVSPLYSINAKYAMFRFFRDHYLLVIPIKDIDIIHQVSDRPKRLASTIKPSDFLYYINHYKHRDSHILATMHLAWRDLSDSKEQGKAYFQVTKMTMKDSSIFFEFNISNVTPAVTSKRLPNRSGPVVIYLAP